MARVITGIALTTELEALNGMLASIGEAPVLQAELETPTQPDVTMAVNILTDTHREVLSMGWRFNTEFGFQIAANGAPYSWTGSDGETATLLVFEAPSDLLAFEMTQTSKMYPDQDIVIRTPRDTHDPALAEGTRIFYDRNQNRDGFESSVLDEDSLYIEGVFSEDYEDCPEEVRRYVMVKATRRFQASSMGSEKLDTFTQRDEFLALRNLKRAQGKTERYNIFNNAGTASIVGRRYRRRLGFGRLDTRNSPRP